MDDLAFYQFSRGEVERCDFRRFLSVYGPEKLPSGRRLRGMMDQMVFCIEGYDDDPREIHAIPEIRRFYSAFHSAWPYWLYFCSLEAGGGTLKAMVFCCLPSLSEMKMDGQGAVAITYDLVEMREFVSNDLIPMKKLCAQAEMFGERVEQRTQAIYEYFGLAADGSVKG